MDAKQFKKEKERMHRLYKHLKVGLVDPKEISNKDKSLLVRYYGWTFLEDDKDDI